MPEADPSPGRVSFGPFEVLFEQGELRKHGVRWKLEELPFRVLVLLLQRPGKVVTREELKKALWPGEDFGEFDSGLNTAVRKVRAALDDSPTTPRFIETVPRRGYRFIYPLAASSADGEPGVGVVDAPVASVRRWLWSAAAVLLVVAGVFSLAVLREPDTTPEVPLKSVPLTTLPGQETEPTFSPDGSHVAFVWNGPTKDNLDIYVQVVGTTEALRLTTDPAADRRPAWSPDGSVIAFIRDSHIVLIPAVGGTERTLATIPGLWRQQLSWLPDGKALLVSVRDPGNQRRKLVLVDAKDGSVSPMNVSLERSSIPDSPAEYSPGGEEVAFLVRRGSSNRLMVADLSSGELRELELDAGNVSGIAWSPEGDSLVASANVPGSPAILWRVPVDGGPPSPIAGLAHGSTAPAVSAAANRLVYSAGIPASHLWRYALTTDDELSHKLIGSTRGEIQAQYSPDGRRIVYIGNHSGKREVWVCDESGKSRLQLTFDDTRIVNRPSWSPDGKEIAYSASSEQGFDLEVIPAGGGSARKLTTGGYVAPSLPAWSPDGQWIYYVSTRAGRNDVWRVRASGGESNPVSSTGGASPQVSEDGHWVYFQEKGGRISRIAIDGERAGNVEPVVQLPDLQAWTLMGSEIYWTHPVRARNAAAEEWVLSRYRLSTREQTELLTLRSHPSWSTISVSPDGKWLLCGHDDVETDLMLVEDFR